MTTLDALRIGTSGLSAYGRWLDTTANDIANLDTPGVAGAPPPQPQTVVMRAAAGAAGGVRGELAATGDPAGVPVYQPDSPVAGAGGMVRYPDTDLGQQMGNMIMAQRGYQLNLATIERARDAYDSVLQLGKKG